MAAESSIKPDCVPAGAPWTWATNGLGERVAIWCVDGVLVEIEDSRYPGSWDFRPAIPRSVFEECSPQLSGSLRKECQVFYDAVNAGTHVSPDDTEAASPITDIKAGGLKFDEGKPPLELIPWRAFLRAVEDVDDAAVDVDYAMACIADYLEGGGVEELTVAFCGVLEGLGGLLGANAPDDHDWLCGTELALIAKVLAFGAAKYGPHNWRKGGSLTQTRVLGAALRHLSAYEGGEELDDETNLPHLAHAACELLFAITYALEGRGDDRWITEQELQHLVALPEPIPPAPRVPTFPDPVEADPWEGLTVRLHRRGERSTQLEIATEDDIDWWDPVTKEFDWERINGSRHEFCRHLTNEMLRAKYEELKCQSE